MNMLISAGTSVAYFSSLAVLIIATQTENRTGHPSTYMDTVVFLTLFILAGRALEAYSKAKTGDAVAMLGKLRPSEAFLAVGHSTDGQEDPSTREIQKIPVDHLEVGDTVNVPHGASPPADGIIIVDTDKSYKFDESSLTGESLPVRKMAGDKVYSGSVNVGQPVLIRITDLGSSSMLDQIVAVVREGQTKRAPVERFADLVTGYFVPMITLIAIVTFVTWLGLGHSGVLPLDYLQPQSDGWTFWSLKFAIAVFVVACPCGLALAAPTALFVGGGLAAKRGILVRGGGEAFQEASRLDAIVFDKTGTLTEGGTLRVSDHEVLLSDESQRSVAWALARALEESSTHPIAQAIAEFCKEQESTSVVASNISEIGGQGMKGTFTVAESGQEVYEAIIGNQRLLESVVSAGADTYYLNTLLARYQSAGRSTAILAIRKVSESEAFVPAVVFATSDPIRSEAPKVIADLRARNIEVYMCTGDNTTTAHAVASSLGIPVSNVMANVLPAQKAEYVRSIQHSKLDNPAQQSRRNKKASARRITAFVGDGTNDSPALAAADVSVAMASGSDVAVNAAGFILLNSDLRTILELCILSRRVFRRVKLNFFWAAIYNMILVPVAAGVFYPIVTGRAMSTDTTMSMDGTMHGSMDMGGTMVNQHWRLDPVWAALAMALSSVSVVMSSLALRFEWRTFKGRFQGGRERSTVPAHANDK
jgi:heavy metal translocating P-type ATPase